MRSRDVESAASYLFTVTFGLNREPGIFTLFTAQTESGNRQLSLEDATVGLWVEGMTTNLLSKTAVFSANHAMIQLTDVGDYYLIDLGSSNGTFVNGRRVSIPVTIQDGDTVTFGQTEFQFYCPRNTEGNGSLDSEGTLDGTATAIIHVRKFDVCDGGRYAKFYRTYPSTNENLLSEVMSNWFAMQV